MVVPEAILFGIIGGLLGGLAVIVWWAFFGRDPKLERWGAVVLMIAALGVTTRLVHISIAKGAMGFLLFIYGIPVMSLAFLLWVAASRRLSDGPRRASMVATILLASGGWTLLRTDGITGDAVSAFAWRWSENAEERLLAHASVKPAAPLAIPSALPVAPVAVPAVLHRCRQSRG